MLTVLTGGSGLVGSRLVPALLARGERLRLLSRRPDRLPRQEGVEARGWDGLRIEAAALAGADRVIHLAGEPVFGGLPGAAHRRRVRESRVASTRALVESLATLPASQRPATLLCASATGYYGDGGETALDESAGLGEGFLAELCRDWEQEAARAEEHGLRRVSLRIGVVLAREGGALAAMRRLFALGLGGRLGSGRQWFSWIHVGDLVELLLHLASAPEARGAVNAVAPQPVRNAELTAALGRALGRPTLLPVPAFALRLALGEFAGELLGSRRVLPARAQELGFRFAQPELAGALAAELGAT